jgi:hypothetical protein
MLEALQQIAELRRFGVFCLIDYDFPKNLKIREKVTMSCFLFSIFFRFFILNTLKLEKFKEFLVRGKKVSSELR